ncbi:MAG: CCA tRNA nucleotidyltransferase [Clostridia bacterium]|nr:CCA tRNA nucleotidyltransferase [Clostridia bacterium]
MPDHIIHCPDAPLEIIRLLTAHGHSAYAVGGCVRDTLLGAQPHDWDITTSALPEETLEIFKSYHTIPTGLQHGTVTVMIDHEPYEITTFRIDGAYSDSRHPESVTFSSRVADDLARRDFTINALAWNEKDGIVDCYDGISDLGKRMIRAVGVAKERFEEDALRILRGYRFASQLDFEIEQETHRALISEAPRLENISRERVSAEMRRLVTYGAAPRVLRMLEEDKIFGYVFVGAPYALPRISDRIAELTPEFEDRFAFLLYECDKETVRTYLHGLRLSNRQFDDILKLCDRDGLITAQFDDVAYHARRLLAAYGELTERALKIAALYGKDVTALSQQIARARKNGDPLTLSALAVTGKDLIAEKIATGKEVGATLSALLDLVLHDPSMNDRETLLSAARKCAENL